jgi:LacI family transcriptional regulator, galactose operon repressor
MRGVSEEHLDRVASSPHRVTVREIASVAGVSAATVSRVLNGRGDVSERTRSLVTRAMREHGYQGTRRTAPKARTAVTGRHGLVVGLLVPLVQRVYFSAIFGGAAEEAYEQGIKLMLTPTLHQHEREISLVSSLMHGGADSALLILPDESSDELEALLDQGYRYVVADPRTPLAERIPSVSAAHASGADQAMQHLLSLGHRRIAAVTGPAGWQATEDRRRGYYAALAAAGIQLNADLEVEGDFEIPGGVKAGEELFDLRDPPTAVFAFNDLLAVGVLKAARSRGLRVPEDVSIVGFDDLEYCTMVTPALTTVRQPLAEMGRTAVNMLVRLLENKRFETLHVQLGTRLVVRESTGPARRSN